MSIKSGITVGTPAKILFGAGVYFHGVEYSETVAPTEEAIKAAIQDYYDKNGIDKKIECSGSCGCHGHEDEEAAE